MVTLNNWCYIIAHSSIAYCISLCNKSFIHFR